MDCGRDWDVVVWNISQSLLGQDPDQGHPIYQFTWHEVFRECWVAAVILRLYHVLSVSPALVLAHAFDFEHRFLCGASWSKLLVQGFYGVTLFQLLALLSNHLCVESPVDFARCEAAEMRTLSLQEQEEIARARARETAPEPATPSCSLEDSMVRAVLAIDRRFLGDPAWETWLDGAQEAACCATAGLSSLLLTGRRLFQALLKLGAPPRPPRRRNNSQTFMERLQSPVQRVEAQWCGVWPRASGRVFDGMAVHCLGASVHVTPSGRRVLEMALYFEREGSPDACGTYFGSHWWRLQCNFVGVGVVQASVLSGLAWIQPIKSNLVACMVPDSAAYPMTVEVDMLAEDGGFAQPVRLELCPLSDVEGGSPTGVAVCTEPLHGLHQRRAIPDLVEHHLRLGFHVDIYDSDGSGAVAYEHFRSTGRVDYFPRFVLEQYGRGLAGAEAAGIHEPAEGCSAGLQEIHCLFRHRGRSRWVAPRLDPDEYFHSLALGGRRSSVAEVLAGLGDSARHAFIPALEFGGKPAAGPSEHVVERFPLCSGILTDKWMVMSDPADVMSSHGHSVRPRPGTHNSVMQHVNGSWLRINHYLEMFGPRFVTYIHASRQQYHIRDRSLIGQLRLRSRRARLIP